MTAQPVAVSDAVDCAKAIQKAFDKYNRDNPDEALYLRIGLSAGEPIEDSGDFFGSAVNLAARLCAHAKPSQILAAQVIREQNPGEEGAFIDVGQITPKGFEHAVQVYEIRWEE